jgi:hypothetical protein
MEMHHQTPVVQICPYLNYCQVLVASSEVNQMANKIAIKGSIRIW